MTPRSVDLRGLTLAEAEAKVRKLIGDVQDESLENYEIMLIDLGADPDELIAELAHHRAELVEWRETAIKKMRSAAHSRSADQGPASSGSICPPATVSPRSTLPVGPMQRRERVKAPPSAVVTASGQPHHYWKLMIKN